MLRACPSRLLHRETIQGLAALIVALVLTASDSRGQVLVGDPFTTSYENWIDPDPARGANWRISLNNPTLMETANTTPAGSNPPAATDNGSYYPMLLVQDAFTSPAAYNLNARMYTSDDDLMGLVFGYQDVDNYFRVGLRNQTPGNLGGTSGLSVQKVSGGVVTQISPNGVGPGVPVITQSMIDNREPIDVRVAVNGGDYEVFFNNVSIVTGSDPGLGPGKIGVQSWAQRVEAITGSPNIWPHWGTEVETISVTQGASTLYSGTFTQQPLPVQWRYHDMANSNGLRTSTAPEGEDRGSFGVNITRPWIYQQTNGFEWATTTAPNVDFIGPAVVVDEPGSSSFSNYEMRVRLGATDNDGIGVLVRVQDDNNFYRINFATEGIGTTEQRAPQGLSVQKVRNGVWTELFRDDQLNPLFVYENGPAATPASGLRMFDLSVGAVGNSLKIQVRDHNGNVITYPLITDNSDPLLTGTVGLATWGTDNVYYTNYAGQEDTPLLSALSAFTDFDVNINRATGNITLTNNGAAPANIRGITLTSVGGGLNPAGWLSVANNYDEPPGNGSVDPDDPWTVVSSTALELSEAEQSGGNGGTLGVGQSVNFGNAWVKSRIEDVFVQLELTSGSLASTAVAYSGTPLARSDLNTDGLVNASDWPLFYPNLLADLSSMTTVEQVLAGDLDGDGDNDIDDFSLFKADFDEANGAGAFQAMLAGVPEPTAIVLLVLGGAGVVAFRRRNRAAVRILMVALGAAAGLGGAQSVFAAAVDLTTFTVEAYPPATSFPIPVWNITPSTATLNSNADANVLYSPDSALNKRYLGRVTPGTDDDVIGFVLGFEPGDAQIGSSADYLLIDWKGADQTFDFTDVDIFATFHTDTPSGPMPVGLALSRVTGSPTADELWQHADLPQNVTGGVTQLSRGVTLGSTAYNRTNGSHLFDIRYSPTNVTVLVDGVEQFNESGSFPDGRFGLYTAWQGPQPTFADFEVLPVDFAGLSATVDRSNGNITLRNMASTPFDFDYYQFDSDSDSLSVTGWDSLSEQNFQSVGGGAHQKWQEAGGSSPAALAEAFLGGMSTLAGGATVSIGDAYNNSINGEDLVLTFRLPSGLVLEGMVEYIGTAPELAGDHNGDGTVDAADYVVWRKTNIDGQQGYNTWRTNFGRTSGTGASLAGAASVPEPTGIGIALYLVIFFGVGKCIRRRGDCCA